MQTYLPFTVTDLERFAYNATDDAIAFFVTTQLGTIDATLPLDESGHVQPDATMVPSDLPGLAHVFGVAEADVPQPAILAAVEAALVFPHLIVIGRFDGDDNRSLPYQNMTRTAARERFERDLREWAQGSDTAPDHPIYVDYVITSMTPIWAGKDPADAN